MAEKIPVLPVDAYPAQTVQTLRYNDHDGARHVNNAVYSTLFEAGRVLVLYDRSRGMPPQGCHFSLVRVTMDYLAEMTWPGDVIVGTGVTHIGTSSVGFRQAVFKDGECCAAADSIAVLTNSTTRGSQPLPDHARALFTELLFKPDA